MKRLQGFTLYASSTGWSLWHEPCDTLVLPREAAQSTALLDVVNAARAHECPALRAVLHAGEHVLTARDAARIGQRP